MKKTAPDRLSEAIAWLLVRNFDFCKKHAQTSLRIGICVATPKIASQSVPSQELMEQLKEHAQTHFASSHIQGMYFSYLVPPLLPIEDEKDKCCPPSVDDFHLTYRIQEFDEVWEQETIWRSLIYCPTEYENGEWHDWFVPQLEAIRLTPLCVIAGARMPCELRSQLEYQSTLVGNSPYRVNEAEIKKHIRAACDKNTAQTVS